MKTLEGKIAPLQKKKNPSSEESFAYDDFHTRNEFETSSGAMGNEEYQSPYSLGSDTGNSPMTAVDMVSSMAIQPKLKIGTPNDKYEQEADAVAERVMNAPAEPVHTLPAVQKKGEEDIQEKCDDCESEEKTVQKMEAGGAEAPEEEATPKLQTQLLDIQEKCDECESEGPEVQKAEEEAEPQLQTKEEEIQQKCNECDAEESSVQKMEAPQPIANAELQEKESKARVDGGTDGGGDDNNNNTFVQKSADGSSEGTSNLESRLQSTKGGGDPLPEDTQSFMGDNIGADFGDVRVHTNSDAVEMNEGLGAKAFTHGNDIYFNEGNYDTNSSAGNELLAHELTHTVQQGGSPIKNKEESTEGEEAEVQMMPDNLAVQMDCDEDEDAGSESEAANEETTSSEDDCSESNPPAEEPPEGQEEPEGEEQPREVDSQAGAPTDERQSHAPEAEQTDTDEAEAEGSAEDPCNQTPDEGAPPVEDVAPEGGAEEGGGEEAAESEAPEVANEQQAFDTVLQDGGNNGINPAGLGEAASPDLAGERDLNIETTDAAAAQLVATEEGLAQLTAGGVQFADPADQSRMSAEQVAADNQKRATSASIINSFFNNATARVKAFIEIGRQAPDLLRANTGSQKAKLDAKIAQRKAKTSAVTEALKAQANASATQAIAQVEGKHQATLMQIEVRSMISKMAIDAKYEASLVALEEKRVATMEALDTKYSDAEAKIRALGPTVGQVATDKGEEYAVRWEATARQQEYQGFWDGWLNRNRYEARAESARETAEQFKEGIVSQADGQADNLICGKPVDAQNLNQVVDSGSESLKCAYDATLETFEAQKAAAIDLANSTKDQIVQNIQQSLSATLESLTQKHDSQHQLLNDYGINQRMVIERDAENAAANVLQTVNDSANQILEALLQFKGSLSAVGTPDPEYIASGVSEVEQQLFSAIGMAASGIAGSIITSATSLDQAAQQTLDGLDQFNDQALSESIETTTTFISSMQELTAGALATFDQLFTMISEQFTQTETVAGETFDAVLQGIQDFIDSTLSGVVARFDESRANLEQGMRDSITNDLDSKITCQAEKAAEDVSPWWKSVLKVLLVIVVIVVVALVLGPAIIGAVGAFAGSLAAGLGASAAVAATVTTWVGAIVGGAIVGAISGGLMTLGNNAIDGKNLMDGVVDAMVVGAIGGALGGLGGLVSGPIVGAIAGKAGDVAQFALRMGVEAAFDVVGEVMGNLYMGQEITAMGLLQTFGTSLLMNTGMEGMGQLKFVQDIQGASMNFGQNVGFGAGSNVVGGLGGTVDVDGIRTEIAAQNSGPREEGDDTSTRTETDDTSTRTETEDSTTRTETDDTSTRTETETDDGTTRTETESDDGTTRTETDSDDGTTRTEADSDDGTTRTPEEAEAHAAAREAETGVKFDEDSGEF